MSSLRLKLAFGTGFGLAVVLLALVAIGFRLEREQVLQQASTQLLRQQQLVAAGLEQVFARAELRAHELAEQVLRVRPDPQQLVEMLAAKLLHDGEAVQFGVLLNERNPVNPDGRFAVSVTYDHAGIHVMDFVQTRYDYWNKDWYQRTVEGSGAWWSDPYFNDAAGGQDTVTYDFPLADAEGRRYGMMSVSVALDQIADLAGRLGWNRESALGDYLLVDARGKILLAWDPAIERAYALDTAAQRSQHPLLHWLNSRPPRTETDRVEGTGALSLAQAPIARVGWRAAAGLHDDDLLGPLKRGAGVAALLAVTLGVLGALLAARLTGHYLQPLDALTHAAERLGAGQLDSPLPVRLGAGEFARLGAAFERSRKALSDNLGRARQEADLRQREEGQRQLAARLQRLLLPQDRVFFGPHLQAQVSALLQPAAAVAGDFYGFVSAAPGVFMFYLGDVRGAGGEAVAWMSRLAMLLPVAVRQGGSPAQVLAAVAEQISHTDDAQIGAQVLIGRVDLADGRLLLASAGHVAPLLLRADGPHIAELAVGPVLSRDAEPDWRDAAFELQPGERLLAVSDGVLAALAASPVEALRELQVVVERRSELGGRALLQALLEEPARHDDGEADDQAALLVALQHRD